MTQSAFEDIQSRQVGSESYFLLPEFTSVSSCKPYIYKMEWLQVTRVNLTDLTSTTTELNIDTSTSAFFDGTVHIFAPDPNSIADYTFNLHVTGEGGNLISTGPHIL
jgi:hypothetical protein